MIRFFNTAGPINPADHYCVPPLERLELDELLMLIGQKKYFIHHAPRQTGKTSCLLTLRDYLNALGRYRSLSLRQHGNRPKRPGGRRHQDTRHPERAGLRRPLYFIQQLSKCR